MSEKKGTKVEAINRHKEHGENLQKVGWALLQAVSDRLKEGSGNLNDMAITIVGAKDTIVAGVEIERASAADMTEAVAEQEDVSQMDELAAFLLENFQDEVRSGERVVDMAIRIVQGLSKKG